MARTKQTDGSFINVKVASATKRALMALRKSKSSTLNTIVGEALSQYLARQRK